MLTKKLVLLSLSFAVTLGSFITPTIAQEKTIPLQQVNDQSSLSDADKLGLDEQLWARLNQKGDRTALIRSINHSLRYLNTPQAVAAYQNYQVPGVTLGRVRRSLIRFRQLLRNAKTPAQLQAAVKREFSFYQSVGNDNQGSVLFTGYYQPIHQASRKRTVEYRYPLYKLPPNIANWSKPHPTRAELEGEDGLQGDRSKLKGLELVWMRDRLEAFLVQVQGSAELQLTDGSMMTVGFAGATDHAYSSLGKELIKDGKVPQEGLTLPIILKYFQDNPEELNTYIPRNKRLVFFQNTKGAPAMGSINVPVTADRSIATDKSLMPPGALALIHAQIPYPNANGEMEQRVVSRYVLDQDTGSAIKGAGRVDYFMGTGKVAGDRSAVTVGKGQLYYLLLKQ
ncbi:MltA domain protein [Crinalium epipsammum PCC 9333]|uniref:peptidoglycan lytic exotransglycosylase n=1 Tax=Crinalium epipsammum PCC 9333 TaxID=1173022 RepID=K9VUI0_9CYAN|nr:murein transglycosylase A [Crinalium epipsammum]AFZ11768.1 MltA domain protein [Crinalium epipsammum PCC 9333]